MKKFSLVVLAAFLFPITLLFVTANANAQITFPLIYGGTYFVQNGYNNWGGGYLDANNTGCEGNLLCVSTASSFDRANEQTGTWKILSATGKQNGTLVLVNDDIYLQNLYPYRTGILGGYLDANNTGCEGNLYCVSTAGVKERSTMRTSHWRFL